MDKRESQVFWYLDEDKDAFTITQETGYACPPNDDMWWVPSKGYSCRIGSTIFLSKEQAEKTRRKNVQKRIQKVKDTLSRLTKMKPI